MAKKKSWTPKEEAELTRIQDQDGITRKSAIRKMRAAIVAGAKEQAKAAKKQAKHTKVQQKSFAGINRAEGTRQFALAGRPSREDFIKVYGEKGPKMTWDERAKAGVPAKQFQAALAAKLAEKAVSRPAAAKSAPTTTQTPTLPLAGA